MATLSDERPEINYLAKDYASFRRLMLERLATLLPGGIDDQPADLQMALVELLAYAADQLSYYQDAVATEAYLGIARSRISLRRHARLLNFQIHEGCNARVWIWCQADQEQDVVSGWRFLTAEPDRAIFEPCHYPKLFPQHNRLGLYSDASDLILPVGSTHATLKQERQKLEFKAGDFLLLETSGGERDLASYHVVRLVDVQPGKGPGQAQDTLDVAWGEEDALPFPLPVKGARACGNIVLADYGQTLNPEQIEANPRLRLPGGGLTYAEPLTDDFSTPGKNSALTSAARLLSQDPRHALPQIKELSNGEASWTPRKDLLGSSSAEAAFVVETEQDGSACLRFGDDTYGRRPVDPHFLIRYRVGNGRAGNVGAEKICHVVDKDGNPVPGVDVNNFMPARGGEDAETAKQIRLFAPQAFRTQRRAVNAEDYAARAQGFSGVQRAAAAMHWTGSWYTVYLFVDRLGGQALDDDFKRGLLGHMDSYRLAGYDLEIRGATYVPLKIVLAIQFKPGFTPNAVLAVLKDALSSRELAPGRGGYFHPDNWTFGQPVYLSRLYKAVLDAPGVAVVKAEIFQRKDRNDSTTAFEQGLIAVSQNEIVDSRIGLSSDFNQGILQLTIEAENDLRTS